MPFYQSKHIKVILSDKFVYTHTGYSELTAPAFMLNGRVMVPLRFISEQLGYPVTWNGTDKTVTITGNKKIVLKLDDPEVLINVVPSNIDAAPVMRSNTTFVPLRFVSEVLGYSVKWDGVEKSALITY